MDLTGFFTIKYILCLFTTRERKERHYIKTITAENIINNIVIPWVHIGYEMVDTPVGSKLAIIMSHIT